MKKVELVLSAVLLFMASCTNEAPEGKVDNGELDTASFLSEIKSLDSIMSSQMPEKKDIKKAMVIYQDYATYFPDDSKTPNYLFKMSDLYLNVGNTEKSVNILTSIIEKYPNFEKIETIYFTRASHVDLDLRDTSLAKTYYQEFIEKYPESEYVNDAKIRFANVGLSMEDIIRNFEEANAAK